MIDLSSYKVPIFTNKNDLPRVPTAQLEGNVSDLIARINNLIDELETVLNPLVGGGSTSFDCNVTLPSSIDNNKIEIYYQNTSDYELHTDSQINFYAADLIQSYESTIDYSPSDTLDISSLIQANGVGYYFFLFMKANGTYKNDSYLNTINVQPKGIIKTFSKLLNVFIYDAQFNSKNALRVRPLAITQLNGTVNLLLADEEFIIG